MLSLLLNLFTLVTKKVRAVVQTDDDLDKLCFYHSFIILLSIFISCGLSVLVHTVESGTSLA